MSERESALAGTARRAAAFGPFFAVEVRPAMPTATAPWRSVADFIDDPATLRAHVSLVRSKLAAANARPIDRIEHRVAASVAHLGLLARLLSPALGIAALCGSFPSLAPSQTFWQPEFGGAFPLLLADEPLSGPGPLAPAAHLSAAFADLGVSPHILRDNTFSALNGAAATIMRAAPAAAPAARALLTDLIADRALVRRRSCCLIYRAAPPGRAGLCGDCPLSRPPARRPAGD